MNNGKFLDELELGEVTPTFEKDDPAKSKHTIDPSVFYQQFQTCLNVNCTGRMLLLKKKKSPYMCGYSKGFSTQQAYFL